MSEEKLMCPSGKKAHRTRSAALKVRRKMLAKGKENTRAYDCPHCGEWHLTHMTFRTHID